MSLVLYVLFYLKSVDTLKTYDNGGKNITFKVIAYW